MPHFLVDDDFAFHQKAILAGNPALGLWVRAGAHSQKAGTDGVITKAELVLLGTSGQAKSLVTVRLWHLAGHDCEGCPQPPKGSWIFHDWMGTQVKTAEQAKREREAARERMRRLRSGKRSPEHGANVRDSFDGSSTTPSPSPSPLVVTSSRHLTSLPGGQVDDDGTNLDLEAIAKATGGDRNHAAVVAEDVLSRTHGPTIRNPTAYVLRAIGAEPDRYKPTPRNPRSNEVCPVPGHSSRAGSCIQCAADAKAGGA